MKNYISILCEIYLEIGMLKHLIFGPLLEINISKKYISLWRKAHTQIKISLKYANAGTFLKIQILKKYKSIWHETYLHMKMLKIFQWMSKKRMSACRCGEKYI